jgi:hypothetical protein
LEGLRSIGLDVTALDATAWAMGPFRIVNSIGQRLYCTPEVRGMNERLITLAMQVKPELVWIDRGNWIYPSTLRRLREHARFLVHYNTDDIFSPANWFWLHRAGIGLFDIFLTTNRWNVLELRARYGVKTFRAGMGYDQDVQNPPLPEPRDSWGRDVVFVGHWEPHTERYISALAEAGLSVNVWGHSWMKAKKRHLRSVKPLSQSDYSMTISTAKIALCVLSRWNRNESTGRSFEIPALGTFMLAERTAEHEFLYRDGEGAALFSDEAELVEKARHYLRDEEGRRSIARNGRDRCRSLGLSWGDHVGREWRIVKRMLSDGCSAFMREDDAPFWEGYRAGSPWKGIR